MLSSTNRMKMLKLTSVFILLFMILYFLGPQPSEPVISLDAPNVPTSAEGIDSFLLTKEAMFPVKPDNQARMVWYGKPGTRTKTVFLYLHGFSASQFEGAPIHRKLAQKFGANLLLCRLDQHGLNTPDALMHFTADGLWESAKEAYYLAKLAGDDVYLISTSTGGTLSLLLASKYPDIKGMINMSPNIRMYDPASFMLNDPFGLQIARLVIGDKQYHVGASAYYGKYWYNDYRLEALTQLEELVESQMNNSTFRKVHCPTLNMYYYKNEQEQDKTVKVSEIIRMHEELGTESNQKVLINVPTAGNHIMGNPIRSKAVAEVYAHCEQFCIEKLKLQAQ